MSVAELRNTREYAVQVLYSGSRWVSAAPSACLQASLASNPQSLALVLLLERLAQWHCRSQRCACLKPPSHVWIQRCQAADDNVNLRHCITVLILLLCRGTFCGTQMHTWRRLHW